MIVRIVQLPITPGSEDGEKFEALFEDYKAAILGSAGCQRVQLLAAQEHYFTYSWWGSESDLNAYRKSLTPLSPACRACRRTAACGRPVCGRRC